MNNPFETIDARLSNIENLILSIKYPEKPKDISETDDQLFTIKQAAKFLNLSVPTLYGYVHRAEIPVCKRAGRLYFYKHELTDWLKAGRKKTVSEIESEAQNFIDAKKKGVKL